MSFFLFNIYKIPRLFAFAEFHSVRQKRKKQNEFTHLLALNEIDRTLYIKRMERKSYTSTMEM